MTRALAQIHRKPARIPSKKIKKEYTTFINIKKEIIRM